MKMGKIDRYKGALLGVAVGDALGAPLEFLSASEIQRKYGTVREMIGGGWLCVEPGEVTDDTQMTLAVAEGIVESPDDPEQAVGRNFLRWFKTAPKDIGGTCRAVLTSMRYQMDADTAAWLRASERTDRETGGWTAGNGALMRTVYPALYYHRDKALKVAASVARLTHWHEASTKSVLWYTDAVNSIVNSDWPAGKAKDQAEAIMHDARTMLGKECPEPTGYSLDSLVCAMNAVRGTDSFEDALVYAVNLGGDADTIGAITGGLAGAVYGAEAIPLRWVEALDKQPNQEIVQMFYAGTGKDGDCLADRLMALAHIACAHQESM